MNRPRTSDLKTILAAIAGTALQWYDFAIFGCFAPIIAANFFPQHNATADLLNVFAMFAVGYLLAPIGSILFGYLGDRYGRKYALTLSILGMAIPTALLGLLPSYQSIGLWAPIAATVLRMLQGLVASSEYSGAAIFLIEHAPPHRRALYGCITSSAYSLGVLIASLIAALLTANFMPNWAWRGAFLLSWVAGLLIFYVRRLLTETPAFATTPQPQKTSSPLLLAVKEAPYAFIGVIGLAWWIGIATFGTYVFTVSYFHVYWQLSVAQASLICTLGLLCDALIEPCMAIFADRIGHLRLIMAGAALMLLLSVPIYWLFSRGQLAGMITGMIAMSLLIAISFAAINAYMISLFPPACRYSGFGVSFHLGIALFGGTTPWVMLWLIERTHQLTAPAYYYIWGCLVGVISILICEYGRHKKQSTVVSDAHYNELLLS